MKKMIFSLLTLMILSTGTGYCSSKSDIRLDNKVQTVGHRDKNTGEKTLKWEDVKKSDHKKHKKHDKHRKGKKHGKKHSSHKVRQHCK